MLPPAFAAEAKDINRGLPTASLKIGSRVLEVEIASTAEQRRVGLMNRETMGEDHGMIFLYEKPRPLSFWMKNTLIPLSAAFIAEDGTIVKITKMNPKSLKRHTADMPLRCVVEAHQGWFKKAGVRVGDRVDPKALARIRKLSGLL